MKMRQFSQATSFMIVASLAISSACSEKPFSPDFDNAFIEILGKEECYTDSSQNAWLINLSNIPSDKKYGSPIVYKGSSYPNVAKTYRDLSKEYTDSINYAIDFKIIEISSLPCNVTAPENTDLPVAEIVELGVAIH